VSATLRHEGDGVYRIEASGTLLKSELDQVQAAVAQEIARLGKVRFLLVLRGFNGWERGADWGDLRFYEAFGKDVERIAIVGDEKWREQVRLFILADVRESPVRFFPSGEIDQARAWLSL
jgi:hypothetical protein